MELPKYIIPRNRQIPDPSFADILNSGPSLKDSTGGPAGDRQWVYRGRDPKLPKSAMIPLGKLFPFTFGLIYVPEDNRLLSDFSAEALRAGAPLALVGIAASSLGGLPLAITAGAYAAIAQSVSPERASGAQPPRDLSAEWMKRGAIFLPGVQIVEIEQAVDPGGFLSKGTHRLILTFERVDGQRTTYTFMRLVGPKSQAITDAIITIILRARWKAEFDYLVAAVKSDHVNADPVWNEYIERYKTRYGGEWGKHVKELIAEVTDVLDVELAQKGFTPQLGLAEIFKRIGPLVPYYQQAPELKEWVRALAEAAGNAPGATAPR
jgi:hypothetical protein